MKIFKKIIPACLAFLPFLASAKLSDYFYSTSPTRSFYQSSGRTFRFGSSGGYGGGYGDGLWGVLFVVMDILSHVVLLLISFAVIFFLYGVLKYITAGGDAEKMKEYKNMMIYGIVSLFIMVSFWGVVNILRNTFDLEDNYVPEIPYFYEYGGGYYGGSGGSGGSGDNLPGGDDDDGSDNLPGLSEPVAI